MSTSCSSVTEASAGSSLFETVSSAFSSFFPTAHADEGKDDDEEGEDESKKDDDDKEEGGDEEEEEGGDDEEEEEDEPEDPMPSIYEACQDTKECKPAKHHFLECQERVEAGNGFKDENCVEEFFHLAHCATSCAAPKLFNQLK